MRTGGNSRQAVLEAVNFGRDTDCLAATAGGLAGALGGVEPLDAEWIEQVDAATMANPHTNRRTTIRHDAEALLKALQSRAAAARRLIGLLGADA